MDILDKLLSLGFQKHIALKAIASNGNIDFQATANWIISHANDPLLKQPSNLNYIALLSFSPNSLFMQHVLKQIYHSLSSCDINLPTTCDLYFSMPLSKLFKIKNENINELINSFNKCAEVLKTLSDLLLWIEPIFTKNTFKCKLNDKAENVIKQFIKEFSSSISHLSLDQSEEPLPECVFTFVDVDKDQFLGQRRNVVDRVKPLINVLCNKSECFHNSSSLDFNEKPGPRESGNLELVLNLMSFEDALMHCRVYHAISKPALSCLMEEDIVTPATKPNHGHHNLYRDSYVGADEIFYDTLRANPEEQQEHDAEEILSVLSCTDGMPRQFSRSSLKRIAKICAWNVISTVPLTYGESNGDLPITEIDGAPNRRNRILSKIDFYRAFTRSQFANLNSSDIDNWSIAQPQFNINYEGEKDLVKHRYIIARHGERTDQIFGHQWTHSVFNKKDDDFYLYKDLNIPRMLPKRECSLKDYLVDSPLTEIGMFETYLTGDYMKKMKLYETINWVYSSPALRSIQTAHFILKGLGLVDVIKIRVEPVLFEWYGWYKNACPAFIKPSKLKDCGFNIDLNYKILFPHEEYNPNETLENYYRRGHNFMKRIAELHKDQGGDFLITGHGGTLEVNTRCLMDRQPRDWNQFNAVIHATPYCATTQIDEMMDGSWKFPPVPSGLPMTYNTNKSYDWTLLHL